MTVGEAPLKTEQRARLVFVHAEIVAKVHVVTRFALTVEANVGVERRQEPARNELEALVAGLERVGTRSRAREQRDCD